MSRAVRRPARDCKGIARLKRLLAATILAAGLIASARGARASTTTTGGAQLQWKASANLTMAIVTQYNAAFAQGNAIPPLLPSAAGVCVPAGTEANFTLSFGALIAQQDRADGLPLQERARGIDQTNDAAGFAVNEYLDSTPTTGVGICAYPNGGAAFRSRAAIGPVPTSRPLGQPGRRNVHRDGADQLRRGRLDRSAGHGRRFERRHQPRQPGRPGPRVLLAVRRRAGVRRRAQVRRSAAAPSSTMYGGEDIQVNLAPNALSRRAGQHGHLPDGPARPELTPRPTARSATSRA